MGLDKASCLKDTGVSEEDLHKPDTQVTLGQELIAIENFVALSPCEAGLGVAVGKRLHVGAFGVWGFAILTSPTVRAGIETAIEYAKLSLAIADMKLEENPAELRLVFDMSSLPESIHAYILERHCYVAITFFREFLKEQQFSEFHIETTLDNKSYAEQLAKISNIDVAAGSDVNALIIPSAIVDRPVPKSDPVTQKFCIDQCKNLLERINGAIPPWSRKVRDAVLESISTEQKIDDIAAKLSVTDRTLRRRLSEEGTNFRQVYTDARLTLAHELLQTARLSVEAVSWRVGYSEPASFVRAFSKRFGATPGEIRKRQASA